jgi:hypothetical protein
MRKIDGNVQNAVEWSVSIARTVSTVGELSTAPDADSLQTSFQTHWWLFLLGGLARSNETQKSDAYKVDNFDSEVEIQIGDAFEIFRSLERGLWY